MDKINLLTRTLLAISLGAGFVLVSTAFAADAGSDAIAAKIKAMDTNGDGVVSADEYAASAKSQFDAMDTDHTGQVTVAKMDAARNERMKGKPVAGRQLAAATIIKSMDSNNDGMLSAEEHARAAEKAFNTMDTNHDGQLSASELRIGYDTQSVSEMPTIGLN